MRTFSDACAGVQESLCGRFCEQRLRHDCAVRNFTVHYIEIVRDRVIRTDMYNCPNVFLCSFYDVYMICSADTRACKRVPPTHKIH